EIVVIWIDRHAGGPSTAPGQAGALTSMKHHAERSPMNCRVETRVAEINHRTRRVEQSQQIILSDRGSGTLVRQRWARRVKKRGGCSSIGRRNEITRSIRRRCEVAPATEITDVRPVDCAQIRNLCRLIGSPGSAQIESLAFLKVVVADHSLILKLS